jgi:outer membrane receptor protein involved in Fe transport
MFKPILLALLTAAACFAQADRAAITGTVLDPSHSAVPGAGITVVHSGTGLRREATSSTAGVFHVGGLPLGGYYVEINSSGFRPVKTAAFELSVGETRTLDIALEVAASATTVEVQAVADAVAQTDSSMNSVISSEKLNSLPVNGRNWQSLMALTPGAVDGANGSNTGVRFFATGGDDVNYRVDGVDATSIRNQNMRLNSRLLMSEDAIAEFRVNSALFTAESGGSGVGQVEVVSKSGSNTMHGSAFEYARTNSFDARGPFDPAVLPPFQFHQYGGSFGGPVFKDKTFFFASYEGLRQNRDQSLTGFVPTQVFRDRAAQQSPAIKPLLEAFPAPTGTTSNPDIGEWRGLKQQTQNEDVGTLRVDHRFTDRFSSYFRFTRNHAFLSQPLSDGTGSIGASNNSDNAPINGVLQFLNVLSPRSTNELRLGSNWVPWDSANEQRLLTAIAVSGFSTAPSSITKITHSLSQSILDNFSSLHGRHTFKAGVEVRRVVISNYYTFDGTITYTNLANFAANKMDSIKIDGENPARTMEKIQYFGYAQDEWKIRPNFTATLGLRYEFYNELTERFNRTLGFNIAECRGYCAPGEKNGTPDYNNLAPRVSFAWSPSRFHGNTVVRAGGGIFYGDAQIGNQLAFTYNGGNRFNLSAATTPGLSYPVLLTPALAAGTAPDETERHRKSETFQQWTMQIQQRLPLGFVSQVSYVGMQNYHIFASTPNNVVNPATGKRTLPNFDLVNFKGDWGVANYHGMMLALQRSTRNGLNFSTNYTFSKALNDSDGAPQNVACRSCEYGRANFDARHNFYMSGSYQLPFGRTKVWGGWEVSGVGSVHTGLPLTVTVSRSATALPDGNSSNQRPNLIPGVSLIPANGRTILQWINPAAFATPANGVWGTAGRNLVDGPRLAQFDAALQKSIHFGERSMLSFRAEAFNLFNHPQLGKPSVNFSTPATFGRITSISNTSPIGTGTARSLQLAVRFGF